MASDAMTPEQEERFGRIVAFHQDLLRFKAFLEGIRNAEKSRLTVSDDSRAKLENLRQSLLRRRGTIEPLFVRVIGNLVQSSPVGRSDNVWQIALHGHPVYSQTYFVQALADSLNTFIGTLEEQPWLLDPPVKPSPSPAREEPVTDVHEERRDRLVRTMRDLGSGELRQFAATDLAPQMNASVEQVMFDFDVLARQGEVDAVRVDQHPFPIRAALTGRGLQRANEGRQPGTAVSQAMNFTFNAPVSGSVQAGQAGVGNVRLTSKSGSDLGELRRLLAEFREAILETGLPEDQRQDVEDAIEVVEGEIVAEAPSSRRFRFGWGGLQKAITGLDQAVKNAEKIQRLWSQLGPKLDDFGRMLVADGGG
jgi:hypothetical protein